MSPKSQDLPRIWYRPSEVAQMIGVSEETMQRSKVRRIPAQYVRRLDRAWFIHRSWLDSLELLDEPRVETEVEDLRDE